MQGYSEDLLDYFGSEEDSDALTEDSDALTEDALQFDEAIKSDSDDEEPGAWTLSQTET